MVSATSSVSSTSSASSDNEAEDESWDEIINYNQHNVDNVKPSYFKDLQRSNKVVAARKKLPSFSEPSKTSSIYKKAIAKAQKKVKSQMAARRIVAPSRCLINTPDLEMQKIQDGSQASAFYCSTCDEHFSTGQALGGHMSRVHPGQSNSYARKIQRREERAFDRELLRLAKVKHAEEFGEDASLDRVKIRRFKKQIRSLIASGQPPKGYQPDCK